LIGIGENIPIALNIVITAFISLIMAYAHGWQLTSLGLIAIVMLVFTHWLVSWTSAHKMVAEIQAYRFANTLAEEVLTNIRTVMFYAGQKKELIRYKKKLSINSPLVGKWIAAHCGSLFLLWSLNFLIWAVLIWFALALVIHDHNCSDELIYSKIDAGDAFVNEIH
jgi:ATP-binding cassette subfamily B (MDR/TAP) protein 1